MVKERVATVSPQKGGSPNCGSVIAALAMTSPG